MANSKEGYVYVLTNPSLPGQVKVGRTERDPQTRLRELSAATGVPTPFELAYSAHFLDCHVAEASAHAEWKDKRVNDGREFFRVPVSEALRVLRNLSAIERQTSDPQVIEDLLVRGRQYLFGGNGVLRNHERALSMFEQAAAMGSAGAAYFAGRAAYKLGDEASRQSKAQQAKAKVFMERALGHFQTAIGLGHVNACAWASWVYRANKQYNEANDAWRLFLARTDAAGGPKGESIRWVLNWAKGDVHQGRALTDPFLLKYKGVLLAKLDENTEALRKPLEQLGSSWLASVGHGLSDGLVRCGRAMVRDCVSAVLVVLAAGIIYFVGGFPIALLPIVAWPFLVLFRSRSERGAKANVPVGKPRRRTSRSTRRR